MHSPFTFNPNAHRAQPNYQQQSGHPQPVYNIGAPLSGFMNHPNHFMNHHSFTRSFASVVSCESNLGNCQHTNKVNNSPSLLNSFIRHFNKPTMPQYHTMTPQNKEFEDFTHMPSLPAHNYINHPPPQHFGQQQQSHHINMKIPIISGQFCQQSAQVPSANNNNNPTKNFMASLFSGYQRQEPQPKPKNQRWFGRGFRCGRGGNSNRWKNPKFHDQDVNLQKNIHEKERARLDRDILDDSCDFVHVENNEDVGKRVESKEVSPKKTADDPPFMICSLEEFPAIVSTTRWHSPLPSPPPPPAKCIVKEEGFVVLPAEASISTPSFVPRRFTLCEKVEAIIKSSPTKINGFLKPCLKKTHRRYSECSEDFDIVFAPGPDDSLQEDFFSDDDESDSESESDDDDDMNGHEMTEIAEEDDDETSDDEVDSPDHQIDSGVEEKRVRFNMTPKVHVMRVWASAYRLCRKGDYWTQIARDHERFSNRIRLLAPVLSPVLSADHRQRIFNERFQETE